MIVQQATLEKVVSMSARTSHATQVDADAIRSEFERVVGVEEGFAAFSAYLQKSLAGIVKRGGRVIVVDPRRTETAAAYEHVPVRPDSDAWLMLSLLHVVFAENLQDSAALARSTVGAEALRALCADFPPEATEIRTGIAAGTVRALARDFATARSFVRFTPCGSPCRSRRPCGRTSSRGTTRPSPAATCRPASWSGW